MTKPVWLRNFLAVDTLLVIDAGLMSYHDALTLQEKILARKRCSAAGDHLIIVEHPNVFTIGRTGSEDNILADKSSLRDTSLEVLHVDRGGDITFHGPGQAVIYPIFDLRSRAKDIRLFIRNLEEAVIGVIENYGLRAYREDKYTGIWTSAGKIGFIGIGVSGWITYHGISLNVNTDLKYFSMIRPCGIEGIAVTSLADMLGRRINIEHLKISVIEKFCEVFGFDNYFYPVRDKHSRSK